jgi:hypothetical protein
MNHTMTTLDLPSATGRPRVLKLSEPAQLNVATTPSTSRVAYAAGHVVADPLRSAADSQAAVNWDATMRIRHDLWDLGLGVAESMDTAQRGMGLGSETAMELARRTLTEARGRNGQVVVGIGTDALADDDHSLPEITAAYLSQLREVEDAGGRVVIMASRHLARTAEHAEDYLRVYHDVLEAASQPVILHWLGPMFDPALTGYWGTTAFEGAAETVITLITQRPDKIAGIKVSLLDADREVELRRRLPAGVRLFTGDDFDYVDLIAGDARGHSDALLGAFAVIPRFASAALARLDQDDAPGFRAILEPTVPLSQLVFEAPTRFYKVGVVWLSYLTGAQDHFRMVGGLESGRSILHLADLVEMANAIGLFPDPDLAAARASSYFRAQGV